MRIRIWRLPFACARGAPGALVWTLVGAALLLAGCGGSASTPAGNTKSGAVDVTITMDPIDGVTTLGGTVGFTAQVNNGTGPFLYDWSFDKTGGGGVSPATAGNVTSTSPVTYSNRGAFVAQVVVTDTATANTGTSAVTVSVPVPAQGIPGDLLWATGVGDLTNKWDAVQWH